MHTSFNDHDNVHDGTLTVIRVLMFIPVSMTLTVIRVLTSIPVSVTVLDSDQGSDVHTSFSNRDSFSKSHKGLKNNKRYILSSGACELTVHVLFRFQNLLWFVSDFAQMKLK